MDARAARSAAAALRARKHDVIRAWEERVRQEMPAAEKVPTAVLVDTVPAFLDALADALSPDHPRELATEGTTIPREHGGERARFSFRLRDVMREYQILRDVLLELFRGEGLLQEDVRERVTVSLDRAMADACAEYVLATEGLRERVMLTLAHDVRSPLASAKWAIGLVLRRPDDASVPRWAARADANLDRVDRMIRNLLDVSRAGSGARLHLDFTQCDVVELLRNVIESSSATPGRLVLDAPEAVTGWWGCDALGRAVENLVANAMKYGSAERPITVRVVRQYERVAISVHNEGSYLAREEREAVFDPFRRSTSAEAGSTPGWGLGLALVRAVAEAHGGSVSVDSLPDRGTTFTLDLALDARPTSAGAPPPGSSRRD
jgi:signal transduction histidine kinase